MTFSAIDQYDAVTAGNNTDIGGVGIQENAPFSNMNNALRELCRQVRVAVASQGANIASAGTTDIGAATGQYVKVTGTTTITALGTVNAGTMRWVEFTGILTLTRNAVSLILPTSANITTAAGDLALFVSLGSGNWRCLEYYRFDGTPLAITLANDSVTYAKMQNVSAATRLLGRGSAGGAGDPEEITPSTGFVMTATTLTVEAPAYAYGESATYDSTTTVMLNDNSTPQITEGKEITTAAITPKRSTSKLLITVSALVTHSSADEGVTLAVFVDATASAIGANVGGTGKTSVPQAAMFQFMIDASSTSARTYRLRYGPATAGTAYINGDTGARQLGGISKATLTIQEIFV